MVWLTGVFCVRHFSKALCVLVCFACNVRELAHFPCSTLHDPVPMRLGQKNDLKTTGICFSCSLFEIGLATYKCFKSNMFLCWDIWSWIFQIFWWQDRFILCLIRQLKLHGGVDHTAVPMFTKNIIRRDSLGSIGVEYSTWISALSFVFVRREYVTTSHWPHQFSPTQEQADSVRVHRKIELTEEMRFLIGYRWVMKLKMSWIKRKIS